MKAKALAEYLPLIRAIEQASTQELHAIARVEQAITGAALSNSLPQTAAMPTASAPAYDPKAARRQSASKEGVAASAQPVAASVVKTEVMTPATPTADDQAELTVEEAISKIAAKQHEDAKAIQNTLEGMWRDEKGRWRQENGAFATRQQKEAKEGRANESSSDPAQQSAFSKILTWVNNKFTDDTQNDAKDAAGVAVGGSYFLAAKEVHQLAKSAGEYLKNNDLDSKEGVSNRWDSIKGAAKAPLNWFKKTEPESKGSNKKEPEILEQTSTIKQPGETPKVTHNQKSGTNAADQSASGQVTPDPKKRRFFADLVFGLLRNPKSAMIRTAQKFARGDLTKGDLAKTNASKTGSSASELSNADRGRDHQKELFDEQTTAITEAIGQTTQAIKDLKLNVDTGPGLLESALDFFEPGKRRGRRGRQGRSSGRSTWRDKLGGWRGESASNKKPAPGRMGSPTGMGAGGLRTPAPAGGPAPTGKMGGMLRAGGAVLSKLALPLTAALAAFDGYRGWNDTEGQRRTFGLKSGEDATIGQKSAMAAGSVLSAGGLSELLFGVSGDDIAKSIYEFFGGATPSARSGSYGVGQYAPVSAGAYSSAGIAAATKTGAAEHAMQKPKQDPTVAGAPAPMLLAQATTTTTTNPAAASGMVAAPMVHTGAAVPLERPPAPAAHVNTPAAPEKPTVVTAQLDEKSLKALREAANGNSQAPATSKTSVSNTQNIRTQQKAPVGQVPLTASDDTMRLQQLDGW